MSERGQKRGAGGYIYPSCGSTQPDGKGIHRKQKTKEKGFRGSMREEAFLSQREGGMQGRGLLPLSLPHALQTKLHTPKKRRSMGENCSAECAGKTAASRRPAKKKQLHHEKGFYREQKKGGQAKGCCADHRKD